MPQDPPFSALENVSLRLLLVMDFRTPFTAHHRLFRRLLDNNRFNSGSRFVIMVDDQAQLVSMLRQQLVRVHNALSKSEERYRSERMERLQVEHELRLARGEAEILRACQQSELDPTCAAARRLVEQAVTKAAAATRECAALRTQLEQAHADKTEVDGARAEASSLRRALHNLSTSFDEQEQHLRSMLSETETELEKHRETRTKCTIHTQQLAESLRALMVTLSEDGHNGELKAGNLANEKSRQTDDGETDDVPDIDESDE